MKTSQVSTDNVFMDMDQAIQQIQSQHNFFLDTHCNLENEIWKIELELQISQPIMISENPLNISFNEDIACVNLVDRLNTIIGEVDILLSKIDAINDFVRMKAIPTMHDLAAKMTEMEAQIPLSKFTINQ